MTAEELDLLQNFMHEKSVNLLHEQNKGFAITGLDINHWELLTVNRQRFFKVSTTVFSEIMDDVLLTAVERFPERFGTGRAEDVIQALYDVAPEGRLEDFTNFLQTEQFCYILQIENGVLTDRILRVDLFRQIKPTEGGGTEFVGGVFHALAHFSCITESGSIPLSTRPANDNIHPRHILHVLTRAFYIHFDSGKHVSENRYEVRESLNERNDLIFAFYYEVKAAVFFVKTVFVGKKPKPAKPAQ